MRVQVGRTASKCPKADVAIADDHCGQKPLPQPTGAGSAGSPADSWRLRLASRLPVLPVKLLASGTHHNAAVGVSKVLGVYKMITGWRTD